MSIGLLFVIVIIGGVLYWFIFRHRQRCKLPPGPFSLPLIGSPAVRNIISESERSRLYKKFGSIVNLWAFNNSIVLVADFDTLNQLFRMPACCERNAVTNYLKLSMFGMSLKRFLMFKPHILVALNRCSFNKNINISSTDNQWSELIYSMDECEKENSFNLDIFENIRMVSVNQVWKMISDHILAEDSNELKQLAGTLTIFFKEIPAYFKYSRYDCIMKYISKQYCTSKHKVIDSLENLHNLLDQKLKETLADGPGDTLLHRLNDLQDHDSSISRRQVVVLLCDLFTGSFESIGNTMMWLLHNITMHQHYQDRMQQEIDDMIEKGGDMESRRLPLCRAVIDETHRFGSVAPLGSPHFTSEAVEINGFSIPQRSIILPDIHYIHNDKKYWGDPEIFRPERFLDRSGDYRRCQRLIPFGVGLLRCIGERWANDFLLNTTVNLLRRYRFEWDSTDSETEHFRPAAGFTRCPPPKKYRWTLRLV